jgi:hypothetical protein
MVESYCELNVEHRTWWIEKWQERNESSIKLINHTNSNKQLLYFSLVNHWLLIVVVSLSLSSSSSSLTVDCSGVVVVIVVVVSTLAHVACRITSSTVILHSPSPHYKRRHFQHLKKDHLPTFPWLIMSKIENKSIGICFLLYSIVVVVVSTLSFLCRVASRHPHSSLRWNKKDHLQTLFIVK